MMQQPVHVEMPGYAMLHLAPLDGQSKLVVKRWENGRWRVTLWEKGSYSRLEALLLDHVAVLEDGYNQWLARAARHADQWEA